MQFDSNTARDKATIQGVEVSIPAPFGEGHVCTANEAAALNQILKENVRNNLSNNIKKTVEQAGGVESVDVAAIQSQVDTYVGEYEFGVRRSGSTPLDPVQRQAKEIATEAVKAALKAKGFKIGTTPDGSDDENAIGKDKYNELVEGYMARDEVQKEAKRRAKSAEQLEIGDLGL